MYSQFKGYDCLDKWTAVLLALLLLILCIMGLDRGHGWGDDFAAYMLEGIAIAEGRLSEQIIINKELHPSQRTFGNNEKKDSLVYVWGLPLVLSMIYRLVGWDMPLGEEIIWYKLPGVFCLSMLGAVLFLFYRRRMPYILSFFLTGLLVLNKMLIADTNYIMTDIPCLTAGMSAMLFLDLYLAEQRKGRRMAYAFLMGIFLWFTYVVRLNGITIVGVVLMGHILELLFRKIPVKQWLTHILPYAVFLLLLGISLLYFPEATSNTDHIASGPNAWIMKNVHHYNALLKQWVYSMVDLGIPMKWYYLHILLYALFILGLLLDGRRSLHLSVFLIGTVGVLLLLPYNQELRYLYNILPIILLYAGYGMLRIEAWLKKMLGTRCVAKNFSYIGVVLLLYIGLSNLGGTVWMQVDHANMVGMEGRHNAYSKDACDAYEYIYRYTNISDRIAFEKPRALYLNTGRISFVPGIEKNTFENADYFLLVDGGEYMLEKIPEKMREEMTIVFENSTMILYKMKKI